MNRRILCLVMVLLLAISLLPAGVLAAEDSYTAELTPAVQEVPEGQTAQVALLLNSEGYHKFNTIDLILHYDAQKLDFAPEQAIGLEGCFVDASEGALHILGFGSDKALGRVLVLAFRVKKSGEASVTIVSCKVDDNDNADVRDAPEAVLARATAVINGVLEARTTQITFSGSGAADVVGGRTQTAPQGEDYTFQLDKDSSYNYTVKMGRSKLQPNAEGSYTIAGEYLDGDTLTVTVEKTKKPAPGGSPQTGDHSRTFVWLSISVLSLMGMVLLLIDDRSKHRNQGAAKNRR